MASSTVTVTLDEGQLAKIRNMMDERLAPFEDRWAKVRDLHKPLIMSYFGTVICDHCGDCGNCDGYTSAWPCATARLVYSDAEIANPPTRVKT